MPVELRPIAESDAMRVGEFLQAHLNSRVTADRWARALDVPWVVERPNAGYMLVEDGKVVGAQLAFYSERLIDGRRQRFCNLGAWCVLPEHRFHSLRLLKALLSQQGYHFTDLSPSGNVVGINQRLGFRTLETETALVPSLPWPSWPRRSTVSSDPTIIEHTLSGRQLELYRDHSTTAAARHVVLIRGDEWCYVVFRRDRFRRLPGFATILHVSDPVLFRKLAHPLARHLLLRHGVVAAVTEQRVAGQLPRLALPVSKPKRRMFLSRLLEPRQIDYLYSELVCVAW